MTERDRGRFAAAMAGLGVAFDLAVPKERISLYFDALRDLSIEAVELGAKEAIRQQTFFPKAKELRGYAESAGRRLRPQISRSQEVKLIEDLTPVEEQRRRIRELAERMNGTFGTTFAVDESRGRPSLVSGGSK